jgi:hypothetical protein
MWVCMEGEGTYFPDLENEIAIRKGMVLLAKPNQIVGFAAGSLQMSITRY